MKRRELLQAAGACALAGAGSSAQAAEPGYDWRSVPFGAGGFIDGFVFHPQQQGLLYARTDIGGAYRFEPASASWQPLMDHLGKDDADLMGVLSLAVDPTDPNRVYAACGLYTGTWARKAALLASTDRGNTWTQHELDLRLAGNGPGRGSGERLQVDPTRPEVLWLGTTENGLLRSTNRGQRFASVSFPGRHVSLVLLEPGGKQGPVVWVGCHDQPGLYVSQDDGASFAREPGTPEMAPQRAALGADGTLYVSFAAGAPGAVCNPGSAQRGAVWKRDPRGRWSDITPAKGSGGWSGLDADRKVPGRLVASTIERWSEGDDVFISHDDGATWQALGARSRHDATPYPWLVNYMRGQDRMGHWLADIKLDPFDGNRAVYGTGYGLWTTTNLAAVRQPGGVVQWQFTVANLEETAALDVRSPSGGATLLAAMGDVSGAAWDDTAKTPRNGLFAPSSETCRGVDFAWLNPGIIARTSDQQPGGGYWSADGGASWRPFAPSPRPLDERGHPATSGQIAVSAKGGFFLRVPDKQAALWSRDRGRTWQRCEGWPEDRSVVLTPVADRTLEGVFYVHDRAGGQVLASADGGQSFKPVVQGLPAVAHWQTAQLVAAPGAARDLWLALPGTLLHLPGADKPARAVRAVAEPWMLALGKGLPDAPYPHSVFVWGRVLVNGTPTEGLFRSDDGGRAFVRINNDRQRYGRLLSMSADPLEHGTVYVAPHGRGVLVGQRRKG